MALFSVNGQYNLDLPNEVVKVAIENGAAYVGFKGTFYPLDKRFVNDSYMGGGVLPNEGDATIHQLLDYWHSHGVVPPTMLQITQPASAEALNARGMRRYWMSIVRERGWVIEQAIDPLLGHSQSGWDDYSFWVETGVAAAIAPTVNALQIQTGTVQGTEPGLVETIEQRVSDVATQTTVVVGTVGATLQERIDLIKAKLTGQSSVGPDAEASEVQSSTPNSTQKKPGMGAVLLVGGLAAAGGLAVLASKRRRRLAKVEPSV